MRKLLAALALLMISTWSSVTSAATMSDLWWNPNESGWGVNIIEQQGTLFVTLFVYGSDGRPAWLVGPDTSLRSSTSSSRVYSGALYTTTGPWFGAAFNPSAVFARQVGTVTFTANSPVSGVLSYSVDGVLVTKGIERQTWKHIDLGGTYYGASDFLSASTCSLSSSTPFTSVHTIVATIFPNGRQGSITMTIADPGGTSTFAGTYTQYGALYEVVGTMTIGGVPYTAAIRDFTADDDGIRGNINVLHPSGCIIYSRFSAVRPG